MDGKSIAVLEGSLQESYLPNVASQFSLDFDLVPFDSYQGTIEATEKGITDVLVASRFFAYKHNDNSLKPVSVFLRPSTLHYVVKKGTHEDVLAKIDHHLSILMKEDSVVYQDILTKNLGGDHMVSIPVLVFWVSFLLGFFLLIAVIVVVYLLFRLKRQAMRVLETERRLHHADKMNAVGHLAGGVAHDFNNMLTGIRGYAEVMASNPSSSREETYSKKILEISQHASDLTQQLLSFSRMDTPEKSIVDCHEMMVNVKSFLDHSLPRTIKISLHLEAARFEVECQKSRIQSALLNLCINAGDAMPDGGHLILTSEDRHMIVVDFESLGEHVIADDAKFHEGDYLIISVKDTGSGISDEDIKHIFNPYYTTKEIGKGTGLGLTAVLGTIHMHNGVVALFSEHGIGTEIRLYLPFE